LINHTEQNIHLIYVLQGHLSEVPFPTISIYYRDSIHRHRKQIGPLAPFNRFDFSFLQSIDAAEDRDVFLMLLPELLSSGSNTCRLDTMNHPRIIEKMMSGGWFLSRWRKNGSLRRLRNIKPARIDGIETDAPSILLGTKRIRSLQPSKAGKAIILPSRPSWIIFDNSIGMLSDQVWINPASGQLQDIADAPMRDVSDSLVELWVDVVDAVVFAYPQAVYKRCGKQLLLPLEGAFETYFDSQHRVFLRRKAVWEQGVRSLLAENGWQRKGFNLFSRALDKQTVAILHNYKEDYGWSIFFFKKKKQLANYRMRATVGRKAGRYFEVRADLEGNHSAEESAQLTEAILKGQNLVDIGNSVLLVPSELSSFLSSAARIGRSVQDHVVLDEGILLTHLNLLADEVHIDTKIEHYLAEIETKRYRTDTSLDFLGNLRGYQEYGVEWLKKASIFFGGGILADEMGLGKTAQVLAFFCQKDLFGDGGLFLVICPRVVVFHWQEELAKFIKHTRCIPYVGGDRQLETDSSQKRTVVVTSYQTMLRDFEQLQTIHFDCLVLDEAQKAKNSESLTARAAKRLQARFRLIVTGTPLENTIAELWNHFNFVNAAIFGQKKRFCETFASSPEALLKNSGFLVLRREKKDVLPELPSKIVKKIYCEMFPSQSRLYENIASVFRKSLIELGPDAKSLAIRRLVLEGILRLRQICCHPELLPPQLNPTQVSDSGKFEELKNILEFLSISQKQKVILFSQFTRMLDLISKWLTKQGLEYLRLDGRTTDRAGVVRGFQHGPEGIILLVSLKAAGFGIDLTSARNVILYDNWWNPAVEDQAIDRAHRIGQVHSVTVFRLVTNNSVEEHIEDLKKEKSDLFNMIFRSDRTRSQIRPEDLWDSILQKPDY
jgi:superfamily II DNA or RNA helicase